MKLLIFIIIFNFSSMLYAESEIKLFGHETIGKINFETSDKLTLEKFKVIKVGITHPDYPPYDMTVDGQSKYYEGVSADYLYTIQKILNIKIKLYYYKDRDSGINALKHNEIDVLTTSNIYEENKGLILSRPYVYDIPVLYTKHNFSFKKNPENIAISNDYLPYDLVKNKLNKSNIIPFASKQQAVAAAMYGNMDGVIIDLYSSNYLINNSFSKKLKLKSKLDIKSKGVSFAFNPDNGKLLKIFNDVLNAIPESEHWVIKKRWNNDDVSPYLESGNSIFNDVEKKWLKEHKVIKLGINRFNAPISYIDGSDNFQGYVADIVEIFKIYADIDIVVEPMSDFSSLEMALDNNKIDLALLTLINNKKDYYFSKQVNNSFFVLVKPKNIEKKGEKNIAINRSDSNILKDVLKKIPKSKVVYFENYVDAMDYAYNNKKNTYAIVPLDIADYYISRFFKNELIVDQVFTEIPQSIVSFASKKDDHEIINIINKILWSIPQESMQNIENKWRTNSDPGQQTWKDYKYTIYTIFLAFSILSLILVSWFVTLKKQYRQKIKVEIELNNQLKFIQNVVDSIPHPIYVRDLDQRLVLFNKVYQDIFATTNDILINKTTIEGRNRVREVEDITNQYSEVLNFGIPIYTDRTLHIDGVAYEVYHWIVPLFDDNETANGLVGGWIDISERNKLISELALTKEEAVKANRTKTQFLATMSHEIRTPMNAIIGLLELALKKLDSNLKEYSYIKVVYDSAYELQNLIGDILDISKIEANEVISNFEKINIIKLLESIIKVFEGLAKQKKIYLTLVFLNDIPVNILQDQLKIKQIVSNLISNSIKFTKVGGVRVIVENMHLSGKNFISICIEDTGVGIPIEDQELVFKPFIQSSGNKLGNQKGTGLGLSISKSLSEIIGGNIKIISSNKKGTLIEFVFPVNYIFEGGSQENNDYNVNVVADEVVNFDIKALIVDDNSPNRILLTHQLEYLGVSVTEAENGIHAYNEFISNDFDLIITDCNMPVLDGYEMTKKVREFEEKNKLSKIVIWGYTANAQNEIKDKCIYSGMNDCLFKPILINDLINKLKESFGFKSITSDNSILNNLSYITNNDYSTMIKILKEFVNVTRYDIDEILDSEKKIDHIQLHSTIHKVKGSAKILGLEELVFICEEIEESKNGLEMINKFVTVANNSIVYVEFLIEYMKSVKN